MAFRRGKRGRATGLDDIPDDLLAAQPQLMAQRTVGERAANPLRPLARPRMAIHFATPTPRGGMAVAPSTVRPCPHHPRVVRQRAEDEGAPRDAVQRRARQEGAPRHARPVYKL